MCSTDQDKINRISRGSRKLALSRNIKGSRSMAAQEVCIKSDAKVISVNVGLPRVIMSNGDPVSTGIFKEPMAGRVMLRTLNLDGDGQADLSVHGGPSKAVYVYPSEHYDYWKHELPGIQSAMGHVRRELHHRRTFRIRAEHWRQVSRRFRRRDGDRAAAALLQARP